MTFNFDAAIKQAEKDQNNKKLGLVLIGPPSGGKTGTAVSTGLKTLHLYTSGEAHGALVAKTYGKQVDSICLDTEGDKLLSADETYNRILTILAAKDEIKKRKYEVIFLDGLTEIETLILNTSAWNLEVAKHYKGNKSYSGPVTLALFRPILDALRSIQRDLNIHYITTCILNVKEYGENKEIVEGEPKLRGFDVATGLIQQFPDRLVVGQMVNGTDRLPRIQMGSTPSRNTKDQITKEVKKLYNFDPTICGVDLSGFPSHMKADLSKIIQMKEAGKYLTKEELK
jgi:hypothetical protein